MISGKDVQKLTQKKYRREMQLCIIEGEKLVREHEGNAIKVLRREDDPKPFDRISSLETSQGILAVVPIPKSSDVTFPYLVLDGIQDPGNVGTILRTAAAFGFNTVFCINSADVWSQKVLRSAMGAQFHLNIHEGFDQIPEGSELYIADLGGTTQPRPSGKFGLVLGSEGQGISERIKSFPHKITTVPISGNVESLNVAVAGGILMHALTIDKTVLM